MAYGDNTSTIDMGTLAADNPLMSSPSVGDSNSLAPGMTTPPIEVAANLPFNVAPQDYFGQGVNVSKLPAGMRNNNPGNIKYVGQGASSGVLGPSVNRDEGDPQAVYTSPLAGMQAAAQLALKKNMGGKKTVSDLIAGQGGWTPGNEQAARNIASSMGVDPDAEIDLSQPNQMKGFLRGLVTQEHGASSKLYNDDLISQAVDGGASDWSSVTKAQPQQNPAGALSLPAGSPSPMGGNPATPSGSNQFPPAPQSANVLQNNSAQKLMTLMMLKAALNGTQLQRVDYDPWAVIGGKG